MASDIVETLVTTVVVTTGVIITLKLYGKVKYVQGYNDGKNSAKGA